MQTKRKIIDENSHLIWIDVLKGIAILFVVVGHNPYISELPTKIFNIIFSFHILLFFFISGYLLNTNLTGRNLMRKRFDSLLKPYLFSVILISMAYILFKDMPSPLWYLFWMLYGNGPNLPKAALHLWFLPNLFLVTIFVWALFRIIKPLKSSIYIQLLVIAALLVLGVLGIRLFWNLTIPVSATNLFMVDSNRFLINGLIDNPAFSKEALLQNGQFILKGLTWSTDVALISAAFFIIGYFVRKHNLESLFHRCREALIILVIFIVLHYYYNYTIDLNMRRYDNLFISTLLACAGIYICMYLANLIADWNNKATKVIRYLGEYSLIIYIFHPIIQSKVYFFTLSFVHQASIVFLPALAAGIALPLLLNYMVLERFKFFRLWYYAK